MATEVIVRVEVEAVRVVATAVGRSRPIATIEARKVKRRIVAIANGRREDGFTVGAGNLTAIEGNSSSATAKQRNNLIKLHFLISSHI